MDCRKNNDAKIRQTGIFRGKVRLIVLFLFAFFSLTTGCDSGQNEFGERVYWDQDGIEGGKQVLKEPDQTGEVNSECNIYIHVCGAVENPGIVCLPENSRVYDALEAAGGFTPEADRDAVNLAASIKDGQKIFFPRMSENSMQQEGNELININTADEEMLCKLPGIGSSKAKAIIQYRTKKGGFSCIEELLEISGIKQGLYEQICDLVEVQ